ncbi:hypothetical protein [Lysobacter sp. CA199]|uniref:hypothetical protein n=1 Tax=Lysobacter sp. CA199 TaxID=3455608 RepID=UPI003F8D7E18
MRSTLLLAALQAAAPPALAEVPSPPHEEAAPPMQPPLHALGPAGMFGPVPIRLEWADPLARVMDQLPEYRPPLAMQMAGPLDVLIPLPPAEYEDPLEWADPLARSTPKPDASALKPPPLPVDTGPFRCPFLPAGSGLQWELENGPDFDVCYAVERGTAKRADKRIRIGLYSGLYPNFEPLSRQILAEGRIDGRAVRWFRSSGGAYARETLFSPRSSRYRWTFHVWIDAANATELRDTLRIVSQLSLE